METRNIAVPISSSLFALFSEENKKKFERKTKPIEFAPKQAQADGDGDSVGSLAKPKKNRKPRKLKAEEDEKAVDTNEVGDFSSDVSIEPSFRPGLNERTIFVGNIPLSASMKSLRSFFKEFGEIDSIRLRSVPIEGTAVNENGNQNLVKKVCVNAKKFGSQKASYNAYIVFKDESSVEPSLSRNNHVIDGRHIRVDKSVPTLFDTRRTVFVGSLSHYTDEEDLRNHFAKCLPNGQDDIENLRLIRDPETLLCKGIGYLLLKDRDHVLKVLSLNQEKFKKRELRVMTCGKRTKRTERAKVVKNCEDDPEPKPKKFKGHRDPSPTAMNAQKRIEAKMQRVKAMIGKKQKSLKANTPHAKTKRLGGVIKRAIKVAGERK